MNTCPSNVRLVWFSPLLAALTCGWDRKEASAPVKPEWCQVLFSCWGSGTMQGQLPRSHNISLFCFQRWIPNGRTQNCSRSSAQPSRNGTSGVAQRSDFPPTVCWRWASPAPVWSQQLFLDEPAFHLDNDSCSQAIQTSQSWKKFGFL